jgi:hypothetical protein
MTNISKHDALISAKALHPLITEIPPDAIPLYMVDAATREIINDAYIFHVENDGNYVGASRYIAVTKADGKVIEFSVGE